jgi:hypothetical protein
VDTLLTLVIALGGIATGIGAIWTAMLARRQLSEQRLFLEEQTEIAGRQAQATERSLALTERSLGEQNERAREENERARLSYEVDMMLKMEDRWESPTFLDIRSNAAKYVRAHFFTADGGLLDVEHLDGNALRLLGVFELLGDLVKQGVVGAEKVWHGFGWRARQYWALYRPAIEKIRQEYEDSTIFEDFERLDALMADLDRERGVGEVLISKQQLRQYVEEELNAPATEEAPTRDKEAEEE